MALSFKLKATIGSLLMASIVLVVGSYGSNHFLKAEEKNTAQIVLDSQVNSLLVSISALGIDGSKAVLSPNVPGQLAIVVDPRGKVLLNSFSMFQAKEIALLLAHTNEVIFKFQTLEGSFWISKRVQQSPAGVWQIIVAHSNVMSVLFAQRIFKLYLYLGFLLLLMVVFGSWLLTRYILLPVTRIRKQAELMIEIESNELLPVSPAGDELTDLAMTLNALLSRLNSSLEREKRLVADVSHELRTPLAILQSKLQLLERQDKEVSREDLLGLIKIAQRIISLTENLLFLAHPVSSTDVARVKSEEVKTIVAEAIDYARLIDLKKMLNINYEISLESTIAIPPQNLRRILNNLLSNAVSNSNFEGDIDLLLTEIEDYVNLIITDRGPGIPEDFIPIAFERFTRADSSRNRESGGSGLGLSLVKSIVDTNGGQVTIGNRSDGGAKVHVLLKLIN